MKGKEISAAAYCFFSSSDSKWKFRFNITDEWRAEQVEMWLVECQIKKICQEKLTASDRLQMFSSGTEQLNSQ